MSGSKPGRVMHPCAAVAQDVEDFLSHGFDYHEILSALGMTHGGVDRALKRANRRDLAERMSRLKQIDTARYRQALGLKSTGSMAA